MTEQTKSRVYRNSYHRHLLATASVIAIANLSCADQAAVAAGDSPQNPPVWLELGWHLEHINDAQEAFSPPFTSSIAAAGFIPPQAIEKALPWSYGAEGSISLRPGDADWVVTASISYGRANAGKSAHQQTPGNPKTIHLGPISHLFTPYIVRFTDAKIANRDTNVIVDFQAGKDVGLGMFGKGEASTFSLGVRFVQFGSQAHRNLNSDPDYYIATNLKYGKQHHLYSASDDERRSFQGWGPSISWKASAPLFREQTDTEVTFDWGINASVLFGRQKASGRHETVGSYYKRILIAQPITSHYSTSVPHSRSRSVSVPNVGGFAGLSLKFPNGKISLGYRSDFFFGAMDGGIDTPKTYDRNFHGPFATVSIGFRNGP